MAPTILVVGATGNTGRGVIESLPSLLRGSTTLSKHRILALTRSANSPVAQRLAAIDGVDVIEHNWTDMTAEWLLEHNVVRAFIAPHNAPNQFAEESAFHVAALEAGLEYVVRISTTAAAVRPNFGSYYPRAHWAIETLLGSPEFGALKWTSLQPNAFLDAYLAPFVQHAKHYKQTGEQRPLSLLMAKDAPVAPNDPHEVGAFAARLLGLDDVSPHSGAKYVINGPQDVTGEQLVRLVEEHIDTKVEDVTYKDLSFLDALVASGFGGPGQSATVMKSIRFGLMCMWEGICTSATTSKQVIEIGGPGTTPSEMLERLLAEQCLGFALL